jgi:outer membrane protein
MAVAGLAPALADTIEAALVRVCRNNPQLNAQRAQFRSTDENVPQLCRPTGPTSHSRQRRLSVADNST